MVWTEKRASCQPGNRIGRVLLSIEPLCCTSVLGHSTVERMLEHFSRVEVEQATILAPAALSRFIPPMRGKYASVNVTM